jgi:hypothetical protein
MGETGSDRELLHLELLAGPDLPDFIAKCRQADQNAPAADKTLLFIDKGAKLVRPVAPTGTLTAATPVMRVAGEADAVYVQVVKGTLETKPFAELSGFSKTTEAYAGNKYLYAAVKEGVPDIPATQFAAVPDNTYTQRKIFIAGSEKIWVANPRVTSNKNGICKLEAGTHYWDAFPLKVGANDLPEANHLQVLEYASGNAYNPGVHSQANANGNTSAGDGPKYRGRGLIQLTWKKNYKKYGGYIGKDLENDPWLIARDMSYAIDSSCWFWRRNSGISQLYQAKGDINVLIDNRRDDLTLVTKAVNGGDNGLSGRKSLYEKIKQELGLELGVA